MTYCSCGASWGRYLDQQNAEVGGFAVPLGFDNRALSSALDNRPLMGAGKRFDAFVIPKECESIKQLKPAKIPLTPKDVRS